MRERGLKKRYNKRRGDEAVKRVCKMLNAIAERPVAYRGVGSYGQPDVILEANETYAIEVKSITGYTGGRIGRFRLYKESWEAIKDEGKRIVIVEIRPRGSKRLYYVLSEKTVNEKLQGRSLCWFTLWQIINYGQKLREWMGQYVG